MKKRNGLTRRQEDVLVFIKKFIAEHGYAPVIREICEGVGLSSPATVFVHIQNLQKAGVIKQTDNKFRTIELLVDNEYLPEKVETIKVPLITDATSNILQELDNPSEHFQLSANMIPGSCDAFVYQVSNDELSDMAITTNDYAIFKRQGMIKDNDIIAVISNDKIKLVPYENNKDYIGILIGIYRKY